MRSLGVAVATVVAVSARAAHRLLLESGDIVDAPDGRDHTGSTRHSCVKEVI